MIKQYKTTLNLKEEHDNKMFFNDVKLLKYDIIIKGISTD